MSKYMRRWMRLVETIADDPNTNALIQHILERWPEEERAPYLDALELIKDAGPSGITPEGLRSQMERLYPRSDRMIAEVIHDIADIFLQLVQQDDRGWLVWSPNDVAHDQWPEGVQFDDAPEAYEEPEEEPPPELSQMVDLAYTGLDLMRELTRQKGSFTEDELAARLATRLRMARPLAAQFARHLLDQFRSMLSVGGGSYAMHGEEPRTRDQNMEFLRSLANKPQAMDDL